MSLGEVCDLSYLIQVRAIERAALAQMTWAPHLDKDAKLTPPDVAVREFHDALCAAPRMATGDPQAAELWNLIGVG